MDFLFGSSMLLLIYTFVGYPLLLKILVKITRNNSDTPTSIDLPDITVLLCIYNGSKRLPERLSNLLTNGYPSEKINIVVVSDGSTDEPHKVLDPLSLTNVKLIHYQENQGKSHALNLGLKHVETEIVIFADIRQCFQNNTILNMVNYFEDPKIGAVSGNLVIEKDANNKQSEPGLYWRYEKWIREKESELFSLIGVTGAVYAARMGIIPTVPSDTLLDDMFIPLSMIKEGYVVKFAKNAIAVDESSSSIEEEYYRKIRTLAGNFQLLSLCPWLLSPFSNPVFFQFFSHKVLRLIMPYCLITLLLTAFLSSSVYLYIFGYLQLGLYCYSFACYLASVRSIKLPLSSPILSFCSLNVAAFMAGWRYYFTPIKSLWKKH
jgi:biofilm PGA synthesis N-glycosyltransferase PgaC